MKNDDILKHFMQASADEGFLDAALKKLTREAVAKIAAIAGETVRPTEKSEWSPMTPENVARMNELLAIDAAKTELRRVAMILHAEARAVLQNAFLCPADVDDALSHLCEARRAITNAIDQTNT